MGGGCEQQETLKKPQANAESESAQESAPNDEPPLLLDDEPLLLLDDEPEGDPLDESGADNSRCFVCHINYMQEDIAVTHARANIGCAGCHGESDEHIADESWASGGNGTPPEIMYRRSEVNPACLKCHAKNEMDEDAHEEFFAGETEEKYMTGPNNETHDSP